MLSDYDDDYDDYDDYKKKKVVVEDIKAPDYAFYTSRFWDCPRCGEKDLELNYVPDPVDSSKPAFTIFCCNCQLGSCDDDYDDSPPFYTASFIHKGEFYKGRGGPVTYAQRMINRDYFKQTGDPRAW